VVLSEGEQNRLIIENTGLVAHIAAGYRGKGVPDEDLEADGMLGLVQAARTHDPGFGVEFTTHATNRINDAIIRDRGWERFEPLRSRADGAGYEDDPARAFEESATALIVEQSTLINENDQLVYHISGKIAARRGIPILLRDGLRQDGLRSAMARSFELARNRSQSVSPTSQSGSGTIRSTPDRGRHHGPAELKRGSPGELERGSICSEDLVAEGMLALVEAERGYDPELRVNGRTVKFISFAWPRVKGAMTDFVDRWQVFEHYDENEDDDDDGASNKVRLCRTEWTDGESQEDERLSHKWHERQTHKWQAWRTMFPEIWTSPEVWKPSNGGPLKGSDYERRQKVASRFSRPTMQELRDAVAKYDGRMTKLPTPPCYVGPWPVRSDCPALRATADEVRRISDEYWDNEVIKPALITLRTKHPPPVDRKIVQAHLLSRHPSGYRFGLAEIARYYSVSYFKVVEIVYELLDEKIRRIVKLPRRAEKLPAARKTGMPVGITQLESDLIDLMIEEDLHYDEAAALLGIDARSARMARDKKTVQSELRRRKKVFRRSKEPGVDRLGVSWGFGWRGGRLPAVLDGLIASQENDWWLVADTCPKMYGSMTAAEVAELYDWLMLAAERDTRQVLAPAQ